MKSAFLTSAMGTLMTLVSHLSLATEQQETTFDHQLMSESERADYRAQLRAAHTEAEREAIHQAHHDLIESRARERGIPLA